MEDLRPASASGGGRFAEARARLERSVEAEPLRQFVAGAKEQDRRSEAIAFLKGLYERSRTRPLHDALRELCTFPEFDALPLPGERAVGRHGMAVLPRERYARLLKSVPAYPFSSSVSGWVILLGGPFFAGAQALLALDRGLFMIFPAVILGYFLAYGFLVVRESIEGKAAAPGWPDAGWIGEYFVCFFRAWMAAVVSFLPALMLVSLWASSAEAAGSSSIFLHPLVIGAAVLGLAGLFYYPMALLMAASTESAWAPLHVIQGFRAIRALGADYFLCWGWFAGLTAAGTAIQWGALEAAAGAPVWTMILVEIPVSWALLSLLIVQMRMLGLLCYARRDDLGWFR